LHKPCDSSGYIKRVLFFDKGFAEGKTPVLRLLSLRRPAGGAGCKYQLFKQLTKTYWD